MAAAKDNINTRMVALISLVGVLFLVVTIMGTDAVYSWSESLASKGKEPGDSTEVQFAREDWAKSAVRGPRPVVEEGIPEGRYIEIPLGQARRLVLDERKKLDELKEKK